MSTCNALQSQLLSGVSIETICSKYGIKAKRHPTFNNLVLFCYDQYNVVNGDITNQSRGHILDESDSWSHVCRPFDRFFNVGESQAANVDMSAAKLFTKKDGSLVNMWWYKDAWHMSTKGSPDGGGSTHGGSDLIFNKLFWVTFSLCAYETPSPEWRDYTFVFELTTTKNVVVCNQTTDDLTLIAVRNNKTGIEIELDDPILLTLTFKKCEHFTVKNPTMKLFDGISGRDLEGYIITNFHNGVYSRVKFKNPDYIRLHNSHFSLFPTKRDLITTIRKGEKSEYLAYFPHYKDYLEEVESEILSIVAESEKEWQEVKHIEDRKTFAKTVFAGSFKWKHNLMSMFQYKMDAHAYVFSLSVEEIYKLLK